MPDGVEVHFIIPTVENAISGRAIKPADIVRGYGGKTVQILNTDAEGRLILADAIAYARTLGIDTIVDLATLTGASVVALGGYTAALFANDDTLATELLESASDAGEDLWRMPLTAKLDKLIDSPVADMKNIGKREGGAITAALFLQRWVGEERWAHLDIAGPSYFDSGDEYFSNGASGYGVATLVRFICKGKP
jgi:leucyl aminopeptidase